MPDETTTTQPENRLSQGVASVRQFFEEGRNIFIAFGGILTAITGAVLGLQPLKDALTKVGLPAWLAFAIYIGLPILLLITFIAPKLWERRRQNRLIRTSTDDQAGDTTSLRRADYFLIGPYTAARRNDFHRADQFHIQVRDWIETNRGRVLILTGLSGTGKTSLLNAFVLPCLEEGTRPFVVVSVRSFEDPLAQLRSALNEPGKIWQHPPTPSENESWLHLLSRTLRRIRDTGNGRRLLIVFDQFEEFVVLESRHQHLDAQMRAFLTDVQEPELDGVYLLISLRSDYKIFLELLGVPPLQQNENWREVPAFTRSTAEEFLKAPGSGLKYGPDLIHNVLDEAMKLDGTFGLIRPIILNMLGVVLARLAGSAPGSRTTRRLLADDLRQIIDRPSIRSEARTILPHLLTDSDNKRPRSIGELHQVTRVDSHLINGCLMDLGAKGYVRQIRKSPSVESRIWELSHDFVGWLLGPILETRIGTTWKVLRLSFLGVSFLLWVAILFVGTPMVTWWAGVTAQSRLFDKYGIFIRSGGAEYTGKLYGPSESSLRDAFLLAAKITELKSLDLSGSSTLHSTEGIGAVKHLRALDLSSSGTENLTDVGQLSDLQVLNLSSCSRLRNIQSLKGCTHLQYLSLDSCYKLENLDGIEKLRSLQVLSLLTCFSLTDTKALKDLPNLQTLNLSGCFAFKPDELAANLPDVQDVMLSACPQLTDLKCLRYLQNLISLDVSNCPNLETLDGLQSSESLERLEAGNCSKLIDIQAIKGKLDLVTLNLSNSALLSDLSPVTTLLGLVDLNLSNCKEVSILPDLHALSALRQLSVASCDHLETLAGIGAPARLREIDVSHCAHLKSLDGLSRCEGLRVINCDFCSSLVSLDGISELPNVTSLTLVASKALTNIEGLRKLQNLSELSLFGCEAIIDFSPIAQCRNLRKVDLRQIHHLRSEDVKKLRTSLPLASIVVSEEFLSSSR